MRIEAIVKQQVARVGIARRFWREFLGDSSKWSPAKTADFFGRFAAEEARVVGAAGQQLLSVLPPSIGAMPDFRAFQNELAGYNEVVRWPLYSYKAYATTGQTQLTFFDQTDGTATLGRADTNMQAPNQLPGNQMHVAHALRVLTFPAFADFAAVGVVGSVAAGEWLRALITGSWCEVTISDKLYLIAAPLTLLPAGCGVGTFVENSGIATANTFGHVNNGVPSNEAIYKLDPPLGILPTRTFGVTLNWRAVQTVTTAGRIGTILDGWRLRSVQ
ncbi:MAG: hypothetical protein L0214_13255 [candidate division NC10 bacterium]|nr:hypothetical protein [candidate division NC10 bacterium]